MNEEQHNARDNFETQKAEARKSELPRRNKREASVIPPSEVADGDNGGLVGGRASLRPPPFIDPWLADEKD